MPRRDDDRPIRSRKKSGLPTWALLLVVAGIVFLAVAGPAAVFFLYTSGQSGAATRRYTREEFRTLVVGKTTDEVKSLVGLPRRTSDRGGGQIWYYEHVTFDPANGKSDSWIQVAFGPNGKVTEVNY